MSGFTSCWGCIAPTEGFIIYMAAEDISRGKVMIRLKSSIIFRD
ncbi:MAG: hypothetical protein ACTSRP_18865 [Candidatus Helarchaeota archaeon]